tara:strand:- start:767 stop:2146 length:1380 start_codon:yes stop_codon:yes gene_type:complete
MNSLLSNNKHLHFIGIGGIGMSGMAELLYNHGFKISGSDLNISNRTKHLEKYKDVKIKYNHEKENIDGCDLVIYSSAINKENLELQEAHKNNIPIMKRAELLGEIIKIKDISVAISGTHGKTTTSSMLGSILHDSQKDPTLIIGGIVNKFNSNNITGEGNIIVVEADEFDKSFLALSPTHAIINNIDLEHLDIYKDIEDLLKSFTDFSNSIAFYGKIAFNNDSKNINKIINKINKPKISFGIKNKSDIIAKNISFDEEKTLFEIYFSNNKKTINIQLNCPGMHNVYNALAATAIAHELGINNNNIIKGLKKYSGVKRRFEIKYQKETMIVDDYAHHPEEIIETIKAARNGWKKKIVTIFQPHLYSRTKEFYKEFGYALDKSDVTIITDIFPSREKPIKGISSKLIFDEIDNENKYYISSKNKIVEKIQNIISKGDMILIMGAGDINSIIEPLKEKIEKC